MIVNSLKVEKKNNKRSFFFMFQNTTSKNTAKWSVPPIDFEGAERGMKSQNLIFRR